jgi:hypothetical protein
MPYSSLSNWDVGINGTENRVKGDTQRWSSLGGLGLIAAALRVFSA